MLKEEQRPKKAEKLTLVLPHHEAEVEVAFSRPFISETRTTKLSRYEADLINARDAFEIRNTNVV